MKAPYLGLAIGLLFPLLSSATLVTVQGTDVSFTYDNSALGLFGQPTVSGDTIYFTPTNFTATSTNGQGLVLTQSTVNVVVTLDNPNEMFTGTAVEERGDYILLGAGSSVTVGGELRAFDSTNPVSGAQASSPITSSSNLTINNDQSNDWVATAADNLSGSQWQGVTSIDSTLENVLTATTLASGGPGSLAFIEKKFSGDVISWTVSTVPTVPLPASLSLLLSGAVALFATGLRRAFRGTHPVTA